MGLFDWLASEVVCPQCKQKRARSFLGAVKCANLACPLYDRDFAERNPRLAQREEKPPRHPSEITGSYEPGEFAVQIEYTNYRGEHRSLRGDYRTMRRRGRHISIKLAPTGRRIGLAHDGIANLAEVEKYLQPPYRPTAVEMQILGYYGKRGGTSPRYQELLRKYPGFDFRHREASEGGGISARDREVR